MLPCSDFLRFLALLLVRAIKHGKKKRVCFFVWKKSKFVTTTVSAVLPAPRTAEVKICSHKSYISHLFDIEKTTQCALHQDFI